MTDILHDIWNLEPELTQALMMSSTEPLPGLPSLLFRPTWHSAAACRGVGVEHFFPPEGAGSTVARRLCKECTVADECLKFALANPSLKGIWAGTSERRRRVLRKQTVAVTGEASS